jgi:hypothetical protein
MLAVIASAKAVDSIVFFILDLFKVFCLLYSVFGDPVLSFWE